MALIHNHIHYKRRRDLEAPGLLTVWIQTKYPGRKPLMIQAIYRQHQRLGIEGSKSLTSQQGRWDRLLTKWEEAATEGHAIIAMGDINLNSLSWNTPESLKSPQDKMQNKMSQMLKERILDKGFHLVGNGPTRAPDNPESRPAALDLMFTNRREKIESHKVGITSFSDHLIQITRKISKTTPNILKPYMKGTQ